MTGHLRLWRLLNQDLADRCEGNLGKFDSEPVVGFQMEKAKRKFYVDRMDMSFTI